MIAVTLTAIIVFLAIPVVLLALEVAFAVLSTDSITAKQNDDETSPLKVAVLVPAHNEAAVIGKNLTQLRAQLAEQDRLVVVAHNCTDDTRHVAARHGAEVVVRDAPAERGKGYALDFGLRHLQTDPPDIVVIVDADCHAQDGAMQTLARTAADTGAPIQALYLMEPHEHAGPGQRVSAFAFLVKNHIRLLGLKRMGLPSHLVGSGMAFPWPLIRDARLASGHIVEDMQLGVDLVCDGHPAVFCPAARVTSAFPLGDASQVSQRKRWEHGHLQMIGSQVPKLVGASIVNRSLTTLLFALDLAIPPLTVFALLLGLSLAIASLAAWFGVGVTQWAILVGLAGLFALSVAAAWWRFGRAVLPTKAILAVPAYIASKSGIYFSFWGNRQQEWVRTKRD